MQWKYLMPNPFKIFRVTDSFLYSINMIHSSETTSNDCLFITSGEDRTLRIHSTSKSTSDSDSSGCIQSIALPCQTLWYTVCLPTNENIAVACSDGSIRLFTQKENLIATKQEQEEYETELSQFAIPLKTNEALSQIDKKQLPTSEALSQPGYKDGQTLMIKNEDKNEIEVYQWSKSDDKWIKIGVAVGSSSAAGGGVGSRHKASYLGKEYDYVFDIQLDDENQKLKLPYNLSEDPYFVAQTFIYKHELSQSYLEEIANFIIKNTQGETIGTAGPSPYFDPFTGENRYIPSAGGTANRPPPIVSASADPFTGSSSYNAVVTSASSHTNQATKKPVNQIKIPNSNEYFPQLDFILFDQINFTPIIKKLKEFQQQISNEYKNELISDKTNIELLENLLSESAANSSNQFNDQVELLFQMIDVWPLEYVFPLIDLVRILVLNKKIAIYLTRDISSTKDFVNKQGQHLANYYFDILLKFINEDKMVNTMLVLKTFCNLFNSLNDVRSVPVQKLLVYMLHERLNLIHRIKNFLNSDNKSFQISFTTLLLNYTVLIEKLFDYTDKFSTTYISDVSMELIEFINSEQLNESIFNYDLESIFRILVCAGTLLVKTNEKKDVEYLITVFKSLEHAKSMCERIVQKSEKYTEKVHKSATYLLKILN
jgi:phospholipase A-2-activating protein